MSDPYSVIFIKSFKFEMPSQKFMSQVNNKWWSVDTVSVVMNEIPNSLRTGHNP